MTTSVAGSYTATFTYNGNSFTITTQGKGDVAKLTRPNKISNLIPCKNGNAMRTKNFSGLVAEVDIIVMRGQQDDESFQQIITECFAGTQNQFSVNLAITYSDGTVESNLINFCQFTFASPDYTDNSEGSDESAMANYKFDGMSDPSNRSFS